MFRFFKTNSFRAGVSPPRTSRCSRFKIDNSKETKDAQSLTPIALSSWKFMKLGQMVQHMHLQSLHNSQKFQVQTWLEEKVESPTHFKGKKKSQMDSYRWWEVVHERFTLFSLTEPWNHLQSVNPHHEIVYLTKSETRLILSWQGSVRFKSW